MASIENGVSDGAYNTGRHLSSRPGLLASISHICFSCCGSALSLASCHISMVYTGPSTGCKTCRDRHVKCDGARPICSKCQTTNRRCHGYCDVCGFFFKDVSSQVVQRQSRKTGIHNKLRVSQTLMKPATPVTPSIDFHTTSISFFFSRYVQSDISDAALSRGHFDHLMPMYSAANSSSPLALAVTVVAGWSMVLHSGRPLLRPWLVQLEMSATRAVKAALADPDQCKSNELLSAVLCLDFADHLSSKATRQPVSGAHLDGALALVQYRGADSFNCSTSRSLLAAITDNALLSALWFQNTAEQDAVIKLPDLSSLDCSPMMALQQLLLRILKLTHALLDPPPVLSSSQRFERELLMLATTQKLYNEVRSWPSRTPPEWGLVVPARPESRQCRAEPLPSLKTAFLIGQWYCTYLSALRLYHVALVSCSHTPSVMVPTPQSIVDEAYGVADAFCIFLPYFHATAAMTPPKSGPLGAVLDRATSALLPTGIGEEETFRGGGADPQHYLYSLLGWILFVLLDGPQSYEGFRIDNDATDYVRKEYALVRCALERETQRSDVFN